ncbi:hypothetical protein AABB24_036253 [Solanum stoloniferum]|uniref:CASP-like protein n=1 Tax=Solanum stoloniferum TaxID=62892 RepID=A0ABD2RBI6_9SOLN
MASYTCHYCSYLIASMALQVIWSFGLAFLDAYFLAKKKSFHNHVLLSLFVVGDWVSLCCTTVFFNSTQRTYRLLIICYQSLWNEFTCSVQDYYRSLQLLLQLA